MGSSKKESQENEKYRRFIAEQKRKQERQADALAYLQMRTHEHDDEGRYLVKASAKVMFTEGEGVLAVLIADGELGRQAGFGQGDELIDALVNASNRWSNGKMKWREDRYEG